MSSMNMSEQYMMLLKRLIESGHFSTVTDSEKFIEALYDHTGIGESYICKLDMGVSDDWDVYTFKVEYDTNITNLLDHPNIPYQGTYHKKTHEIKLDA